MVDINKIISRELWTQKDILTDPILHNFLTSGLFSSSSRIKKLVNSSDMALLLEIQFVKFTYNEPAVATDDTTTIPLKDFSEGTQRAFLGNYANAWSIANLADKFATAPSPITALRSYLSQYWKTDIEKRFISMMMGIYNDNVRNDGKDLVLDKSGTKFNYSLMVDAYNLKGDHGIHGANFLVMHSRAFSAIKKYDADRIRPILDEKGRPTNWSIYDEKSIIIVNDLMPIESDLDTTVALIDAGGVIFEENSKVPLITRADNELQGNGWGISNVITRKSYLLHINGFDYTKSLQKYEGGATYAELQSDRNWDRKVDKKLSPISFLKFRAY
jgi:hypothetical protein